MAIQLFPQMNFQTPSGSYGSPGIDDGITKALKLEQLEEYRSRRRDREGRDMAIEQARTDASTEPVTETTEEGLTVNLGTKTVPLDVQKFQDNYQKNLTSINPEAGAAYADSLGRIRKDAVELESAQLDLKQKKEMEPLRTRLVENRAKQEFLYYVNATQGKDKKGALSLINPYEKEGDQTTDFNLLRDGSIILTQSDGDKIPINANLGQFLNEEYTTRRNEWLAIVKAQKEGDKDKANLVKTRKGLRTWDSLNKEFEMEFGLSKEDRESLPLLDATNPTLAAEKRKQMVNAAGNYDKWLKDTHGVERAGLENQLLGFDSLPPAYVYKNRGFYDKENEVYKVSDGVEWKEVSKSEYEKLIKKKAKDKK